ncbi:MAG: glycerate kinase [Actinomycetota bacterium]|nr:glycerate kinase [Actinomycetota bacterium]
MKVVVAPDKFRGSLSAAQAAHAIAAGLRRMVAGLDLALVPVADGGDGTIEAAVSAGYTAVPVIVRGPTGEPVQARFARRDATAIVELAEASGLRRLTAGPDPTSAAAASSYGAGELITAALDAGARRVVLGVGGSASTDGGTGLASALGVRFLDAAGNPLPAGGGALLDLSSIEVSGLDPRLGEVEFIVATDVDNPLVGAHGAARVYGPQKGADPPTVERLDQALRHLASVIYRTTGRDIAAGPGTGAAGGVAATALPLLGAVLRSGSDLMLRLLGLPEAVDGAALVITGEGSLDEQSLRGKAPHGVAQLAAAAGVSVVAIAGRVTVTEAELARAGIARAYSLTAIEPDPARSMSNAAHLVAQVAEQVARDWLPAVAGCPAAGPVTVPGRRS